MRGGKTNAAVSRTSSSTVHFALGSIRRGDEPMCFTAAECEESMGDGENSSQAQEIQKESEWVEGLEKGIWKPFRYSFGFSEAAK